MKGKEATVTTSGSDRRFRGVVLGFGAVVASIGLVGRLILVAQGHPFMEGRLYALFISGLVLCLLGLSSRLLFDSDGSPDAKDKSKNTEARS